MLARFKKDYVSYLLGILVPALINFITIPFFKNILGSGNFGIYTFYFSILLIFNASFSGGITQSIIRLHVDFPDAQDFYAKSLRLSFLIQILISAPLFIYIQLNFGSLFFSVLFILAFILSNIYTTLLAVTQANLFSGVSAISEGFRTVIFLGLSLSILLIFPSVYFLNAIFIALASSYLLPVFFLFKKNQLSYVNGFLSFDIASLKTTALSIFKYGGFLILWFFFSYGISFGNRFVLAHYVGKEGIGHYVAGFDIISRSIVLILSPVLMSIFPLIVKAQATGDIHSIAGFINKLTIIEVLLLLLSLVGFYFIGFPILSGILKTPQTDTYLLIDLEIIVSTFVWQIAMLQHKFLELQKKTGKMLLFIAIGFMGSLSVDFLLISTYGVKYGSMGFLIGGILYLLAIVLYKKYGDRDNLVMTKMVGQSL